MSTRGSTSSHAKCSPRIIFWPTTRISANQKWADCRTWHLSRARKSSSQPRTTKVSSSTAVNHKWEAVTFMKFLRWAIIVWRLFLNLITNKLNIILRSTFTGPFQTNKFADSIALMCPICMFHIKSCNQMFQMCLISLPFASMSIWVNTKHINRRRNATQKWTSNSIWSCFPAPNCGWIPTRWICPCSMRPCVWLDQLWVKMGIINQLKNEWISAVEHGSTSSGTRCPLSSNVFALQQRKSGSLFAFKNCKIKHNFIKRVSSPCIILSPYEVFCTERPNQKALVAFIYLEDYLFIEGRTIWGNVSI